MDPPPHFPSTLAHIKKSKTQNNQFNRGLATTGNTLSYNNNLFLSDTPADTAYKDKGGVQEGGSDEGSVNSQHASFSPDRVGINVDSRTPYIIDYNYRFRNNSSIVKYSYIIHISLRRQRTNRAQKHNIKHTQHIQHACTFPPIFSSRDLRIPPKIPVTPLTVVPLAPLLLVSHY